MKKTRVLTLRTNSISWLTMAIVMPWPARWRITASTSLTIVGSSAEVGSSKRMISGFMARQRAMAARCFCPPDSSPGRLPAFSRRPTSCSSSIARASAASRLWPSSVMGQRVMLSRMVRCSKRLKFWNTMPILRRSRFTSAFRSRMSTPSISICPPEGSSKRFRQRRKVLLPVPEGPITEITSPLEISQFTSRRTVSSRPALLNTLLRCLTVIMADYFFELTFRSSAFSARAERRDRRI